MTGENPDPIAVTSHGSTLWLECFAESPRGPALAVIELSPGTSWDALTDAVQAHQERYKCAPKPGTPE